VSGNESTSPIEIVSDSESQWMRLRSLLKDELVAASQSEPISNAVVFEYDFALPLKQFVDVNDYRDRQVGGRLFD
jgi:hypothetical protein